MGYQLMWKETNDAIRERYELTTERIDRIIREDILDEPYRSYFVKTGKFILAVADFFKQMEDGTLNGGGLTAWQQWNQRLYEDILPGQYHQSYANPTFATTMLGSEYGRLLCFLYSEIRGEIIFAHESRLTEITLLNELFIEAYNLIEQPDHSVQALKEALYWFTSDNSDITVTYRVREILDPSLTFASDLIMTSDLNDLSYLYQFGEYISESEIQVASFLNQLPQDVIDKMADTYTEGYRKGFETTGRDLRIKKTVVIRYQIGFERMVKKAIKNFRELGLQPIICRAAVWSINRTPNRKAGYHATSANKQYDYDHRYDHAIYWNKLMKDRKLSVIRTAYETYRELAADYAGPAVIETFGEAGFDPVNKPEAVSMSEKQEGISIQYANEAAQLANQYVPGDQTSFTIIAFPLPAIGERFEQIFDDTIKINTLDYELYKDMQQIIIDALDQAVQVHITGKAENQTDLIVAMQTLKDPQTQTNFENCVADVNIPLGEVFTSPKLKGTTGLLHVSSVFIGDIQFKELKIWFEDGMVKDYRCDNFEDQKESKDLVRQVILKNHETLPMGEFAIGTNTVAYAMAREYDIIDKLPILIVEKMGPHFAVGDTCYSWSEDAKIYNFDKKEITAKDNEISALRSQDLSKAYFNCHTDITIPYDELDSIIAVSAAGTAQKIIENGKFVLKGIEELNKPLT